MELEGPLEHFCLPPETAAPRARSAGTVTRHGLLVRTGLSCREDSLPVPWTVMEGDSSAAKGQLATALVKAKYEKLGEAPGKTIRKGINMYIR